MNKRNLSWIVGLLALAGPPLFGVQINEVRIDEPGGTDSNEFIELKGAPGTSLDGYWYLVLGDHTSFGSDDGVNVPDKRGGTVEFAISLDGYTIPDDGLFLITTTDMQIDVFGLAISDVDMVLTTMNFENSDNVTHLLVRGYTGIEVTDYADQYDDLAVDIDDDDDGTPNATLPWTEVVDAIGIVEVPNDSNPEEFAYGAALGGVDIGPDGSFTPGMVYRGSDDGLWQIGSFNLLNAAGDGLFEGDDLRGPAVDTPGAPNPVSPAPVVTPSINSFSPTTAQSGDVVTIKGQNLNGATAVTVGGVAATYTVVDAETIEITIDDTLVSGVIEVTTPAGQAASASELSLVGGGSVIFFEDFEADLGDFTVVSAASNRDWRWRTFGGNGFAEMNGFGGDTASDDWLISPAIDLTAAVDPVLNFSTARNFEGPALKVLISSDHDGLNPATATWVEITATLSEGAYEIVASGDIDLSAYVGGTIHLAFQYVSTGTASGEAATIQVHEVLIQGAASQVDASIVFTEDFQESLGDFQVISVASNKDWTLGNYQGEGYAGMNGFGADTASDDWLISPAIDLSAANAPVLTFSTARNFDGPALQVLASGNYDGVNPAAATWTPVTAALSEGGYTVVQSGDIDLSAYVGGTVHIAFRYTSDGGGPGQGAVYQINEVAVRESTNTFTVGWTQHPVASWTYMYTPAWGYNLTMGFINIESLPWVYQPVFGYVYMSGGSIEAGLWCYLSGTGWVWVATGNGGWFEFASGGWNSFLNPQSI